jgi:RimJ/RimL family protein N-acetyltransferase
MVQVSPPDKAGFMSLGISVDIVKAAAQSAGLVIAQVNENMPRVHGDSFLHVSEVDFLVPFNEPILQYHPHVDDKITSRIGKYVAQLIQDGDTLQVGYGSIANEILANLTDKKHLGVHTELLTDGIVDLMEKGVIDNTKKSINNGKTVAGFCMGSQETYAFLNDNPAFEFRTIDYVNNPLIIAQNENMTAINSALEIDLTGQATAESLGKTFYSGIGGQADFMRGAVLAANGKTILTLESTAEDGKLSRIVPFLKEGAGVTLNRGDVHYVVTEYGIAYLHGKNIRERTMALIAIAHPKFRPWLIEKAKENHLIYEDQEFVGGKDGEYPEALETHRLTESGIDVLLRPVKISDEPLLKDFFYSLSDNTLYRRFFSMRRDMPHDRLQQFVVVDYSKSMMILATLQNGQREEVVGMGQYFVNEKTHTAEVAFSVRDDYQNKGIATEVFRYLTYLAKKKGLLGFTAEIQMDNRPMLRLNAKMGFDLQMKIENGVYDATLMFTDT